MQKRTLKVALLAVVALVLVLGFSGSALAATWSDMPDTVTAPYGVTDNQVAAISQGFTDGLWRPFQSVTRAQFVKMAVAASHTSLYDPAVATFTDVPKGSHYYKYIEGAVKAGLVLPGTTFGPNVPISRLDAVSIMSRWISAAHGIDLATYYTADEIAGLLAHFGDKASIPAASQALVAFAYDWGITVGDKFGNFNGAGLLTRIQGATFLIRAQAKVPPAMWTADKIEVVSGDKAENLIGQTHTVTFKVTDAAGHPAVGVLVDFDTLYANPLYVGNISPQAAVTNSFGEVQVNLVSHEPGTEKVSATVRTNDGGLATQVITKYWLALDEVYITDLTAEAENNAGDAHEWGARVIVFGPGERSTSQYDWYNWISTAPFDPTDIDEDDGIDGPGDDADYADEVAQLKLGFAPRTMAGIDVNWSMWFVADDPDTTADETFNSVGKITKVDGVAITPAVTAKGTTDEDGLSTIEIYSEQAGESWVTAVADYAGNPYPKQLFNHDSFVGDWDHWTDWHDQPADAAWAYKVWIPHVIGGDSDAPITPQYAVNNTGEVETFTLTLEDTFGNVIPGYTVEWWIQGVGFFKSDSSTWVGTGEQNKDVDVTNSAGQATVDLKSLVPGQTIVHCKVMDKYGLPYKEWNVVKQWYSIDDVTFGLFDSDGDFYADDSETNLVNTGHTWTLAVSGAKYVYTIYDLNTNGLRDDKVLIGDRADMKAKAGNYANFDGTVGAAKAANVDPAVGVPFVAATGDTWYIRFADMDMLDNEFWVDMYGTVAGTTARVDDGIDEVWAGLAGKDVYFYNNQYFDGLRDTPAPQLVGSITSATKIVTDEMGFADVDINSTNKGNQTVVAVVDYPENPQDGDPLKPTQFKELRWDVAYKLWTADYDSDETVKIFAQGILGEANGYRWTNPIRDFAFTGTVPVTISAPAAGTAATGTATVDTGGAVTAITVSTPGTGYTASDIGRAVIIAAPPSAGSGAAAVATLGTTGPTNNQVQLIAVTNGGSGYTVAPTVVIGAPQIAGGTQAVATANVAGGSVVSVTVTTPGSGYTSAPAVSFSTAATTATATIATLAADGVATVTVTGGGVGYTAAPAVTFPLPLKTAATASATATNGVITAVNLLTGGAGYITAPAVIFGGTGTGAAATATVADGVVSALTLVAGGSGYMGASTVDPQTEKSANPNRETLAVAVFDKYGNALQGYKVTFEIVGQGTITAGTIPTYHPYAHFEDPEHDIDLSGTANDRWAGLGDLNPYVNANPNWNRVVDLAPVGTENDSDDDYAWGYTLNHEINYITNPTYAATVDLVMDETRAVLVTKASHFTDIVNIQVFDPAGVRILEKEVTKVWSTDTPQLTTIQTSLSLVGTDGPWSTSVGPTILGTVYYRVQLFDQYGDPWTGAVTNLRLRWAGTAWSGTYALTTPDADGVITGLSVPAHLGTLNYVAFQDTNNDGAPSAGELASNVATATLQ